MFENINRPKTLLKTAISGALLMLSSYSVAGESTFANPILDNGADPWVTYYDGNYYSATTTWGSTLTMRKSPTLAGLRDTSAVTVWSETDPKSGFNFWAFEFHRLKGPDGWRWYMMYTSGRDGTYDYQHLSVLESAGDDPMGPYEFKGAPMPDSYNIDGSYITIHDQLYLMYSQWQGDEQRNMIVKMKNPWTIEGEPSLLTRPEKSWERVGMNVNEGPEPLIHDGKVYVVYSASYCATPDYKLALLELVGDDPLDPDAWKKSDEPIFTKGNGVYGPGHNGFFVSPDGSEQWLAYHGNPSAEDACGTKRALRAQPFTWNKDGSPNLGEPVASGKDIAVPSGENGPLRVKPQAPMMRLNHFVTRTHNDQTHTILTNTTPAIVDQLPDGSVRFADYAGGFLTGGQCADSPSFQAWTNQACQRWDVNVNDAGLLTFTNKDDHVNYGREQGEGYDQWSLSPLQSVAIVSAVSGKVVTGTKTTIEQQKWTNDKLQQWWLQPEQDGTVTMVTQGEPTHCLNAIDHKTQWGMCVGDQSHWYLYPRDKGGYSIVNKASGQLLGVEQCSINNHAKVGVSDDAGKECQSFYLRNTK